MTFATLSPAPPADQPWGINYGGGTNSTALIIECFNRGLRPDWILFSDTGSERPETYASIERLGRWCMEHDFTPISTTRWERQEPVWMTDAQAEQYRAMTGVTPQCIPIEEQIDEEFDITVNRLTDSGEVERRYQISHETIEAYCLRTGYMPSKAYGFSGCSVKFKVQPAQRWRKERGFARTVYAIGFDAGEASRVNKRKCERTLVDREEDDEQPWYPLFAWGITREACRDIIAAAGLPQVAKSACFFCPNNRRHEWERLQREHPDLYERALAIEANAVALGNARENGLLRSNGYLRDFAGNAQQSLFWVDSDDHLCACYEATLPAAPPSAGETKP